MNVLLTHHERQLGVVGPFPVDRPRWHDVAPVNQHLAELLGVPTVVLRLLDVRGGGGGRGGLVSYHAELLAEPPADLVLRPATPAEREALRPQPHRAGYATAAGVRAALDWAEQALAAAGRQPTGPVEQVKTWNLAGLFRLPTAAGPVWLKTGRQFAVDEAAVIALFASVDPESTPTVVAADPGRRLLLLDHVPGEDCWGPSAEVVADAVPRLVRAQAALAASYPGGAPAGLRDRTPAALVPAVEALLDGPAAAELTAAELADARALVARLPHLVEQLTACGLPDVVLHGDFHPGNWRSDGRRTVLVDFADACYGHPAIDGLRPKEFCSEERWAQAAAAWCESWRTLVPGCDPERALRLAAPFGHLGYAVRYQEFLDAIEPSEHPYHAGDPAAEIRSALAALAAV
ncbi:aminoglycoside phosphotransferase family protein [Kitasatospora sp. RB6PN24]|uniref:aminoglycoside phosphotransferase family protein n=1 Tax=Kitasatospora humi TaxID=2893891 RepID=UPI001E485987|nr:aminoglycoside phosphotransferase family protein [Kitasatospora humi]MCC9306823.1 aminoglycoside phosphotransferase family protein [Kitasatospora humi]